MHVHHDDHLLNICLAHLAKHCTHPANIWASGCTDSLSTPIFLALFSPECSTKNPESISKNQHCQEKEDQCNHADLIQLTLEFCRRSSNPIYCQRFNSPISKTKITMEFSEFCIMLRLSFCIVDERQSRWWQWRRRRRRRRLIALYNSCPVAFQPKEPSLSEQENQ